jgi:arginine exporter protein ArgO
MVALVLSGVLIQGYRALGATGGREAVAADLFLGIGAVAVTVVWFMVFSTAIVA